MDKGVDLHRCRRGDGRDLVQGQFPGQHGPLEAEFPEHLHTGGVVDRHLGRGVQGDGGEVVADQPCHGQVLHDHAVDPHGIQRRQGVHQLRQFLLLDQGVEGDIDPAVVGMGIAQHPLHLCQAEVLGPGPGGELPQAGVDGIGSLLHGGEKRFQGPGRGQEFRFLLCRCHLDSHF